jgi:hypothetical protein
MESIKFEEYKQKIIAALGAKDNLGITESVTLIDGFVNQPIQNELSGAFMVGGPAIPMIMLLGNNSGHIYYFALKAVLPDIKL